MTKTLDEQIEERKQQALDRRISHKANAVLIRLGNKFNNAANPLAIRHDVQKSDRGDIPDYHTITISYNDKAVYIESHHTPGYSRGRAWGREDIQSYVPGEWEQKLDAAYAKAEKIRQDQEAADRERYSEAGREKAKRALWGL